MEKELRVGFDGDLGACCWVLKLLEDEQETGGEFGIMMEVCGDAVDGTTVWKDDWGICVCRMVVGAMATGKLGNCATGCWMRP